VDAPAPLRTWWIISPPCRGCTPKKRCIAFANLPENARWYKTRPSAPSALIHEPWSHETGQWTSLTTQSDTSPSASLLILPLPRLPITIRPASLLGKVQHLLGYIPRPRVASCDRSAQVLYLLYLLAEDISRPFDVEDVQSGAGSLGQTHGGRSGQLGLLGAVSGEQDPGGEDAHCAPPPRSNASLTTHDASRRTSAHQ
jgi:hypothetical protein